MDGSYVIPARANPRRDEDTPLQELGGVNDLLFFSGIVLSLLAALVEGRGRLRNRIIVEGRERVSVQPLFSLIRRFGFMAVARREMIHI